MLLKNRQYFIWVAYLIAADQLSKWLAYKNLGIISTEITSFLSLTFTQNYGAAFSFLADQEGWQRYFLSGVSLFASLAIIVWMLKTPTKHKATLVALTLILSGAIGNLIDRVNAGFVIDFIDFHYAGWHFPIFNFADIFISLGAILLISIELRK
ncbi:Lipoprotein signal peptidase [uncultured Candidatus Thioglobus sp.]|nr:Lipoprotein signal peptidase [uncultured Candidatus Thioglobus sp.]